MTEKTEALRLAEQLEAIGLRGPVAAELRRLHTENERLHQINQSHEMKLSVRGYEIQIADFEAQRDALLGKLKAAIVRAELRREGAVDVDVIRAAIKAVEGEKT